MASNATIITSTADCGDPSTAVASKKDSIKLALFMHPTSTAVKFTRTALYATDGTEYLIKTIGHEAFDERKALLSLPEKVDSDVYGGGQHKAAFEKHIAKTLGKQHGLFFITGVQAQLAALKIHCERKGNPRVAWHSTCHLESAEERSFETLYGLKRILIGSDPSSLPTVDEIKAVLSLPESERPAAVVLELPNRNLGCQTYSFSDLKLISSACKEAKVALHLDGARLWEIEPFYVRTAKAYFPEITALFDSVYASFYKGLGGASGAMLVDNDESFIAEARMWQRRAGGNPFTLAYEVVDCERGFNENIGTFARKGKKMEDVVSSIKASTSSIKTSSGEAVVKFLPEDQPTCCQIRTLINPSFTNAQVMAARDRAEEKTGIRVLERLWPPWSLDDKMAATRAGKSDEEFEKEMTAKHPEVKERWHEIEWMIKGETEKIETKVFADGWAAFCQELVGESKA